MAAKKKGPGKGRGPAGRPPSPAKRVTIPKQATAKPPAGAADSGTGAKPGQPSPAAPGSAGPPPTTAKAASAAPPPAKPGQAATQPGIQSATQSGKGAGKPAAQSGKAGAPPAKPGAQKGTPAAPSAKGPAGKGPAAKGPAGKGPAGKGPAVTGPAAKGPVAKGKAASGKAATPASAPAKGRPRGGPTKEERLAAAAAERRRRAIRNKALVASGVVSILFVVGFVLVTDRRERSKEAASFQTASCTFDRESDGDAGPGRNHVPNPNYDVNPPAGGDHTAEAAGPGVFTADQLPLEGQVVHALEHGFIVLWHRPDLDEPRLTALREVAQKHPGEVLMVPRPTLPTPLAATAWHRRLLCQDVEVDTIERFIDTFVDKGPEKGYVKRDGG